MAGLAEAWAGSVVFLGSMGDEVWRRDRQDVASSLARPRELQPAFAGLREFRLRTGIVFVHVPTIGAVHAGAIHRIARSAEMAPWSLGTTYDRPVPRRIVEDAGIPREAFGHTIHMTIDTQTPEILRRLRRSSFAAFVNATAAAVPGPLRRRLVFEWRWGPALTLVAKGMARALHGAGRRLRARLVQRAGKMMIVRIVRWQWHEPMPILYTFHWGTAQLIRRYLDAAGEGRRVEVEGAGRWRPADHRAR
jgi:hypothetical protein